MRTFRMQAMVVAAATLMLAVSGPTRAAGEQLDVCSERATGLSGDELAVVCYAGNFLEKMLTELDGGQNKTVEHVRLHLLPYLGGTATLQDLTTDVTDDPNCKVCFINTDTAEGLTGLRNSLSESQLDAYDKLEVCYAYLTERVMRMMRWSSDGVWLIPMQGVTPFDQVVQMFTALFSDSAFDVSSCMVAERQ